MVSWSGTFFTHTAWHVAQAIWRPAEVNVVFFGHFVPSQSVNTYIQKTWATSLRADLEPLSGPRVFGYARWRKDWVKVSLVSSHGTVKPGMLLPETWSIPQLLRGFSETCLCTDFECFIAWSWYHGVSSLSLFRSFLSGLSEFSAKKDKKGTKIVHSFFRMKECAGGKVVLEEIKHWETKKSCARGTESR